MSTMRALGIAATGMDCAQKNIDIISHNIANAETIGYKNRTAVFADLMYQQESISGTKVGEGGQIVPVDISFGLGTKYQATYIEFEQGTIENTSSSPKDVRMAIKGLGFFKIELPDGTEAYSRNGEFIINSEGVIAFTNGYLLSPSVNIPNNLTSISISESGVISYYTSDSLDPQELGSIPLYRFINDQGLEPIGDNLFVETTASGPAEEGIPGKDGFGKIAHKALEESNVNTLVEITDLIKIQRLYEQNAKVIQTVDQMMKTATDSKA